MLQLQKLQEELSAARVDMLATRAEAAAADAKYKATVAQVTWAYYGGGPAFADADDLVDSAVEIRVRVQLIGHARNNM